MFVLLFIENMLMRIATTVIFSVVICLSSAKAFAAMDAVPVRTADNVVTLDNLIRKAQNECSVQTDDEKENLLIALKWIRAYGDVNAYPEGGNTALWWAAYVGDLETVTCLLSMGANTQLGNKGSALHAAVRTFDSSKKTATPAIVRLLLKSGVDVNVTTSVRETPLLYGRWNDDKPYSIATLKVLLESGADVNAQDKDGETTLMCCASSGALEAVKLLVNHGANILAKDVKGRDAVSHACRYLSERNLPAVLWLLSKGAPWESTGWSKISQAVILNEAGTVRHLLSKGGNINVPEKNGGSYALPPLALAAKLGHTEIVQVLLANHADVNMQGIHDESALILAAEAGHTEIVKLLLENHADVACTTSYTYTGGRDISALVAAAGFGSLDMVKALLAKETGSIAENPRARLALVTAARHGNIDVVAHLLDRGLSVNTQERYAMSVLTAASGEKSNVDTVNLLLARGADTKGQNGVIALLNAADNKDPSSAMALIRAKVNYRACPEGGRTPLCNAVRRGNTELVRFLLDHDVSPDQTQPYWPSSPLNCAITYGHTEIIHILLERGANVKGDAALQTAAKKGYATIVELLLSRGARINSRTHDKDEETALHVAAKEREVGIIDLLISRGADIGIKNAKGETAWEIALRENLPYDALEKLLPKDGTRNEIVKTAMFFNAAKRGNVAAIERILSGGFDTNSRDVSGTTALHLASECGRTNVVSLLLSHGAEVDAKNNDRMTPLMFASERKHPETVSLLLAKGADSHVRDNRGMTALARASAKCADAGILTALLANGSPLEAKDDKGRTALLLATQGDQLVAIEKLLRAGANINAEDNNGITPFKLAVEQCSAETLKLLLSKSAEIPTASIILAKDAALRKKKSENVDLLLQEIMKRK